MVTGNPKCESKLLGTLDPRPPFRRPKGEIASEEYGVDQDRNHLRCNLSLGTCASRNSYSSPKADLPKCYIGYRNLQKAISLYQETSPGGSNDTIEVWWRPYFLDQEPPKESIFIQDRMLRRMDPKMVAAAQTRLKRVGADAGIRFRFGGYIGSFRLAHQLLHMAAREGSELQCWVSELLFHYQFEEEADISQLGTVIAVGVQAGLREWIASGAGIAEMEAEAKKARADGVTGVPHFVIGGKHHMEGAVDMSQLFQAFVAIIEGQ